MNGDGIFNGQILVDKLSKLNCSQQSIETLSHWCIFHRKKAKQVVETWDRQFHCSPREQRVSFLYLANDILQNSRRKGMEFVGEFWRVLPHALNDVIDNGDEFGKKTALRLVDIWEERKVFSPRGQNLKEDFLGRNRNGKSITYKLKQPTEDMLEKLILSYRHVSDGCDEDTLFGKCRTAVSAVQKMETEFGNDFKLGGSGVADELQVQHGLLGECIEQLKAAESSRTTLMSYLREALNEQELKVEQLHTQLQVVHLRYEQVGGLLTGQANLPAPPPDQNLDEVPPPPPPPPPASAYSEAPPPPDFPPESPLAAADMAPNVTSSSSAHMLTYVLSSLASEGVISNNTVSNDYTFTDPIKRPRLDNGGGLGSVPCYLPQPPPLPPPPPLFHHPDSVHQPLLPPRPLMLPPVPPPLPSYSYGSPSVQPTVLPGYRMGGVPPYPGPPNPIYSFQGPDGRGYIGQPPFPSGPPPIFRR